MTVGASEGVTDAFCQAFAQVIEERFAAIPVEACLVWDIAHTPDEALLHIAEFLGLRRVLGAQALRSGLPGGVALLARRGSVGGLTDALAALGYTVTLVKGLQNVCCDGSILASGEPNRCGADAHWAVCRIELTTTRPVTSDDIYTVWTTVDYFGRRSLRYVLQVTDATSTRVFRSHSLVAES